MDQGLEQRLSELGYDAGRATDISVVKACRTIASIFGKDNSFAPGMVLFEGYTRLVVSLGGEQHVLEADCLAVTHGDGGLLLSSPGGESIRIEGGDEKGMYLPSIDTKSYFYDRVMIEFVRLAKWDRKSNTMARMDLRPGKDTVIRYLPDIAPGCASAAKRSADRKSRGLPAEKI